MKKFTKLKSAVIPLNIKNVDTDMIFPAQYLRDVNTKNFGEHLFKRLKSQNPEFPFNLTKYDGAKILLADDNFGCGSSREHAVWALLDWGISVVISSSYADIFAGNAAKNGLLTISLAPASIQKLFERAKTSSLSLEVNLEDQTVVADNQEIYNFNFDPFRKHCIFNGLDDLDYLIDQKAAINKFFIENRDTYL